MKKFKNVYKTPDGKVPFDEWLEELDFQDSHQVLIRVGRLLLGNTSNCEPVGSGVHEVKMYLGPGYRIYFANLSDQEILILSGGTKKRQQKDIDKAIGYLKNHKMKDKHGKQRF